jgi:hypothetical protein
METNRLTLFRGENRFTVRIVRNIWIHCVGKMQSFVLLKRAALYAHLRLVYERIKSKTYAWDPPPTSPDLIEWKHWQTDTTICCSHHLVPQIHPGGENINKMWTRNTRQKDGHRKFYRWPCRYSVPTTILISGYHSNVPCSSNGVQQHSVVAVLVSDPMTSNRPTQHFILVYSKVILYWNHLHLFNETKDISFIPLLNVAPHPETSHLSI